MRAPTASCWRCLARLGAAEFRERDGRPPPPNGKRHPAKRPSMTRRKRREGVRVRRFVRLELPLYNYKKIRNPQSSPTGAAPIGGTIRPASKIRSSKRLQFLRSTLAESGGAVGASIALICGLWYFATPLSRNVQRSNHSPKSLTSPPLSRTTRPSASFPRSEAPSPSHRPLAGAGPGEPRQSVARPTSRARSSLCFSRRPCGRHPVLLRPLA